MSGFLVGNDARTKSAISNKDIGTLAVSVVKDAKKSHSTKELQGAYVSVQLQLNDIASVFSFGLLLVGTLSRKWQFAHSAVGRGALFVLVQSDTLKYMDLCWVTTAIWTEVFSAWFSLQMSVTCSVQPNLLLTHACQITWDQFEGSCCCVMISLHLHSTISLADCGSLGWGAHQAVFCKIGSELPLQLGGTSSIAIYQSGYEALYNKQAWELAVDIYLSRDIREENSVTWLVVCSRFNTLNCTLFSAPWDPGDVLVHHVICASRPCVSPYLASGSIDKIASSNEIILGRELYAPWDSGGGILQVFADGGLRASRMLRRGECHVPIVTWAVRWTPRPTSHYYGRLDRMGRRPASYLREETTHGIDIEEQKPEPALFLFPLAGSSSPTLALDPSLLHAEYLVSELESCVESG